MKANQLRTVKDTVRHKSAVISPTASVGLSLQAYAVSNPQIILPYYLTCFNIYMYVYVCVCACLWVPVSVCEETPLNGWFSRSGTNEVAAGLVDSF
jgi:hypothetical protein